MNKNIIDWIIELDLHGSLLHQFVTLSCHSCPCGGAKCHRHRKYCTAQVWRWRECLRSWCCTVTPKQSCPLLSSGARSNQVYWRGPVTNTVYFPEEGTQGEKLNSSQWSRTLWGWILWQNAAVSWWWWWWCYCVKLHFVWPRAPARADKSATNVNNTHTQRHRATWGGFSVPLCCLLSDMSHSLNWSLQLRFFFYRVNHSGLCSIRLYNPFRLTATQIQLDHLAQGQILMIMYTSCVVTHTKIRGSRFFFFKVSFSRVEWKQDPGLFFFQITSSRTSISDTIMMQTRRRTWRPNKQLIINISVWFEGWAFERQRQCKVW